MHNTGNDHIDIAASLIDEARELGAATLHEAAGGNSALPSAITPVGGPRRLCGPAFTVSCAPCDNLALHRAVYEASPGDVLVAITGNFHEAGYWGEILTHAALMRKLGGLVIDGCVRDADALAKLDFPVFATGLCIRGTNKNGGDVQRPLQIGSVMINPGDLIVGDSDGVVVLARHNVETVIDAARKRAAREIEWIRQLKQGARTLDILRPRDGTHRLR